MFTITAIEAQKLYVNNLITKRQLKRLLLLIGA